MMKAPRDENIKVLFTEEEISARVAELADQLVDDLSDSPEPPIFIAIMGGAVHFYSDVTRAIGDRLDIEQDFMTIKSREGQKCSGTAKILLDLRADVTGRDVVIVEDLVDTCLTMNEILKLLEYREPRSIRICVCLEKTGVDKVADIDVQYVGFQVPNVFVVGYGMDEDESYRQLPYIGVKLAT